MDVVIIFNGLGNQMSQYAFYLKKKSINTNTEFITFCNDHNGLELNKVFNIDCGNTFKRKILYFIFRLLLTKKVSLITDPLKLFLGVLGCKIINENFNYNFNPSFLKSGSGLNFYYGGWHSDKYFISESSLINEVYDFHSPFLNSKNTNILDDILNSNSISFHIRRGDFMSDNNINLFGSICNNDYYNMAIDKVENYIDNPHYFIFSNDMEWVKANIKLKMVTYVECNSGNNSWIDLYLMSNCKHNIIANSSFSWWGGWLNKFENKIVICPSKFSSNDINSDVFPSNWIKIIKA